MRALFVSDGTPGYWLTINPADLNSPIVVVLAATEHDVSQYQLILTAAILKRALEDAKSVTDPSETQLRIRRQEMDKFAFNRLPGDREISGPQAVSLTARVTIARRAPSTFFEHYRWRGPRFSGLCLYEYMKLVVVKTMASAISTDIRFLPEHPLHEIHIQNYSERRGANDYSVTFTSSVLGTSPWRIASVAAIRGGHSDRLHAERLGPRISAGESINLLSLLKHFNSVKGIIFCLLALLVPWERLPPLFAGIDCIAGRYIDHCADVWELIWLSVPLHLQGVAWNIELLRKCKADAQIVDSDSDDDDGEDGALDDVDDATESNDHCTDSYPGSELEEFTEPSPDDTPLGSSPDFQRISPDTLQQWRQRLSGDGSGAEPDDSDISSDASSDSDGARRVQTLGTSDNAEPLHPIPDRVRPEADPTIVERIFKLGPNPTGTSVTELVRDTLAFNQKQFLVVTKILSHAIQPHGKHCGKGRQFCSMRSAWSVSPC
ncbi:hypothetical protein V8E54_002291 [Elaphomyces granulatus]